MTINEFIQKHRTVKTLVPGMIASFCPHVICKDGFKMSVQAGQSLYSDPKDDADHLVVMSTGAWQQGCEKINACFAPYTIVIKTGETILFENQDEFAHNVLLEGETDYLHSSTDIINPNESFVYKFSEVGRHDYWCTLHPWMKGSVVVKDTADLNIPDWVRNNAAWWAQEQIDDSSFASGIQFLIKEGIIKVQYKKIDASISFAPGINENLIMYQTNLPAAVVSKGVFSAIVVHATHNDYCSNEENKITAAYAKITEIGLKKNARSDPVQVVAVCMKLDVIKESSYPLVLKELGANRSNIMIFIGDIEANFESYIILEALGWWRCEADYTSKWAFKGCGTHIIVVCDECTRPDAPDLEDVTANEEQVSFERAREIAESRNWASGPDHRGPPQAHPPGRH